MCKAVPHTRYAKLYLYLNVQSRAPTAICKAVPLLLCVSACGAEKRDEEKQGLGKKASYTYDHINTASEMEIYVYNGQNNNMSTKSH